MRNPWLKIILYALVVLASFVVSYPLCVMQAAIGGMAIGLNMARLIERKV